MTPVRDEPDRSAKDTIDQLLGHGWYVFGGRTPGRKKLKPGDQICFYTRFGGGEWHPNSDTLPYRGTSAGGGYSTVEDLARFANALLSYKLLNAQYTHLLTTGKVETPGGQKYAYGFVESIQNGHRSFGHGGGAPGQNGDLEIFPQSGYVVVVLSNLDPPSAQYVSSFISKRLPAQS